MAHYFPVVVFVFLTVFSQTVEPCLPRSVQASVPRDVMAGHVISRVNLDRCGAARLALTSDDPRFSIQSDGAIVARQLVRVPLQGRTISIWFHDQNGLRRKMDIGLSQRAREVGSKEQNRGPHRRYKRRWSPLPFLILENDRPPFPKDIDLIGSDTSQNYSVYYEISGPGVTEYPSGVFSVDRLTGMLRVHKAVDREKVPVFKFTARVINQQSNVDTDEPLIVTVNVQDLNDNTPQFSAPMLFPVPEKSPPGTVVGTVIATDTDEPDTPRTLIKYSLLSGKDLFFINPATGAITTTTSTLDREVQDKHFVVVEIKDMNGASNGRSNTGTASISLQDINDNAPTFTKKVHSATVRENENSGLILRIPVEDKDLKKTPNWKAVFKIIKGNENGNFRIETDPETNEGLLYIAKPLDYEKGDRLTLEVLAENEAPLVGTTQTWASALVDISVLDVDEGPEFVPPILTRVIKENIPNGTVIGTYTATDPETKSSAGIRYFELSDPASWINVVEKTGELKITNTVDRESDFVQNGMYNMTLKAVDASSKSCTGTVIIQVLDENDNIPTTGEKELVICEKKGELGSVLVVAEDKDQKPFSDPFTFRLPDGHDRTWTLKTVDDTSALLQQAKELPTGEYEVPLEVLDQQGSGKLQTVTIRVCKCRNGKCPPPNKSSALGVWGILALLLGLALLLLFVICCAMQCVRKAERFEMVDGGENSGMLLKSNTEAPGDAVTSDIIIMPSSAIDHSVKGSLMEVSHIGLANANSFGAGVPFNTQHSIYQQSGDAVLNRDAVGIYGAGSHLVDGSGMYRAGSQFVDGSGMYRAGSQLVDGRVLKFMDSPAQNTWNTNGLHINEKLQFFRSEDGRYADDLLHSYDYEGEGSPAGSVGCCSEQGDEESLDFLNTLGPKFRSLAEVCNKK
ncbi:hypothetical protein SKAU_G00380320 [Synaphobranchus kaupii]|uniref:Cadherin domain-containing protein n=1 Tax=Synaphobranchus kaupii TaxID=118154 RepID=A0A9Q1IEL0_SYNKA|nr:hypothetical protein SKAU_G00380320 [Synaphobranchus kaupii]